MIPKQKLKSITNDIVSLIDNKILINRLSSKIQLINPKMPKLNLNLPKKEGK